MKTLILTAISSLIAVVASNFIYQLITNAHQWDVAIETSFFQFIAIALFAGLMAPKMRRLQSDQ